MKRRTIISLSVCSVFIAGLTFAVPNATNDNNDLVSDGQRAIVLVGPSTVADVKNDRSSLLPNKQPDLRVEKETKPRVNIFGMSTGGFDEYVKLTNVGRSRITILNVLLNEKEHCAKLGTVSNFEPPVTLDDMGGWSSLRFVCSGEIVEAKVETDRGNATYSWR
jgi:hypothetical protein